MSSYTSIIIHQFDPERQQPGGIDTCIRALIRNMPTTERVLVLGTSTTRKRGRVQPVSCEGRIVDFIPVSRLDPTSPRRLIPHSIRMAFGILRPLLRYSNRNATVQIHRSDYLPIVSALSRKTILFVHTNVKSANGKSSDSFWRHLPKLQEAVDRKFLKKASLCIVFNKSTAEQYSDLSEKVVRSTTWFDESKFSNTTPTMKDVDALWVGRFEAPKDPVLGLNVLDELLSTDTSLQAIMIGDGSLACDVQDAHRKSNSRVLLAGARTSEEVARAMARAKCLIMTSHFEGSPVVLFEALASGTPVIATADADPDQMIQDGVNGFRIQSRNPSAFLDSFELLAEVDSQTAKKTVREYSSQQVTGKIWDLIAEASRVDGQKT